MGNDSKAAESRATKRQKVLKAGKILPQGDLSVIDCAVRDMSATGAKLTVGDQAAIPSQFRLVVPMDGTMHEARVEWRKGDLIGIRFTGEAKRAPPRKW